MAVSGSSTTNDTSILTITRVRPRDVGSYVCTVTSGSLSVVSNAATLAVYGETFGLFINFIKGVVQVCQTL